MAGHVGTWVVTGAAFQNNKVIVSTLDRDLPNTSLNNYVELLLFLACTICSFNSVKLLDID